MTVPGFSMFLPFFALALLMICAIVSFWFHSGGGRCSFFPILCVFSRSGVLALMCFLSSRSVFGLLVDVGLLWATSRCFRGCVIVTQIRRKVWLFAIGVIIFIRDRVVTTVGSLGNLEYSTHYGYLSNGHHGGPAWLNRQKSIDQLIIMYGESQGPRSGGCGDRVWVIPAARVRCILRIMLVLGRLCFGRGVNPAY